MTQTKELTGFEDPKTQVEYSIFSVCKDVQALCEDYDNNKSLEVFFTKQSAEEINLAAIRLTSLAAAIIQSKLIN